MKLFYNSASPYVRKVMIIAHETGLDSILEKELVAMTPLSPDDGLNADNPIGKVPTLITDDGQAIFDSRVVCEYLDSLHDKDKFFPSAGTTRWTALRRQSMGDGVLDAAILCRYETFLRPEDLRWPDWIAGQKGKVSRALDVMETEAADYGDTFDIGTLACACALGYLDFRFAEDDWRATRPALASWFNEICKRPSLQATEPSGPGTSGPFNK